MRSVAVAIAMLCLGCEDGSIGGGDGLDFDVDLVDACPTPTPFFFGLMSVEVQLRGNVNGTPCAAASRCVAVPFSDVWDPEQIEQALRTAAQPLLSSELDAVDFKIIGSTDTGCDFTNENDVFMCGIAPLSSISSGVLEVPIDCAADATGFPVCPLDPVPDCSSVP